jgi:hypothetical protein
MNPRRALVPLLGLAFALLGLAAPGSVPAAQAVTGSPPVTTPDSVTVLQGNAATVQPVNNDHDPDNDLLAICRLGTEHYRGLETDFFANDWGVFAKPNAKPGTYTFTYYACDYSYLSAGTITVTVKELPKIKVTKIDGRPGALRVKNPVNRRIVFLYGSFQEDRPDGRVIIAKRDTVVIRVHRTRIDWIATSPRGDIFYGTGHVRGIELPRGQRAPVAHLSLSSRLASAWRAAS